MKYNIQLFIQWKGEILCVLPLGSCAVSPAQLSGTDVSVCPGSSCTLSCPQWHHDEFAHGCSGLCWSTSQLWPSRNVGSCSQWEWAGLAPEMMRGEKKLKFNILFILIKLNMSQMF